MTLAGIKSEGEAGLGAEGEGGPARFNALREETNPLPGEFSRCEILRINNIFHGKSGLQVADPEQGSGRLVLTSSLHGARQPWPGPSETQVEDK